MNLSIGIDTVPVTENNTITPEYLYYFETGTDSDRTGGPEQAESSGAAPKSAAARLWRAIFPGLTTICLLMVTISAPLAAPIVEAPASKTALQFRGADALRAQMSALRGGLPDLRQLRRFLDDAIADRDETLARARHLIETMPAHEKAGAAAWRVAAVASLSVESGTLSEISGLTNLNCRAVTW